MSSHETDPGDSAEIADLKQNLRWARNAARYAVKVIENYAMDIRSDPKLITNGFCQGSIYTEAKTDIANLLCGKTDRL